MGEEKLKKIVSAATVAAVLLAVVLACVIVYQLLTISAQKRKRDKLYNEIKYYEQIIKNTEDEIIKNSSILYIEQRARELGFIYENDKIYGK